MRCSYKIQDIIEIATNGKLNIKLQAVAAGGNSVEDKDWHAVEDFSIELANHTVSGCKSVSSEIKEDDHSVLEVGHYADAFPVGESQMVVRGKLGANCFALTYVVNASVGGTASVNADNVVLEAMSVAEDGGVSSLGGAAGDITLGDGLEINDNELQVISPVYEDLSIEPEAGEGEEIASLADALAAIDGASVADVFGDGVTITDINNAFDGGKSLVVIAAGVGYVFNRLSASYDSENGDTDTFIYTDADMTSHTVEVAPTGVAAS